MASNTARYRYPELPSNRIRLLKLTSIPYSPVIQGRFATSRDAIKGYTAISYTWGSSDITDRLVVDGEGYIPLTHSAAYILLRAPRSQWLWIDSVCIDQANQTEREKEIPNMWQLYAHARLVMVWLGDLSEDADLALTFIHQWDYRVAYDQENDRTFPWPRIGTVAASVYDAIDALRWKALHKLFCRPWFQRCWVVQEVATPRKIVVTCGGRVSTSWKKLSELAAMIKRSPGLQHKLRTAGSIVTEHQLEARLSMIGCSRLSELMDTSAAPAFTPVGNTKLVPADAEGLRSHDATVPPVPQTTLIVEDTVRHIGSLGNRHDYPSYARRGDIQAMNTCLFCDKTMDQHHTSPEMRLLHLEVVIASFVLGSRAATLESFGTTRVLDCLLAGGLDDALKRPSQPLLRAAALARAMQANIRVRASGSILDAAAVCLPPAIEAIRHISLVQSTGGRGGLATLQENLLRTAEFKATDPRDRIYSLLSFSFRGFRPSFLPDYQKSVAEVFAAVTAQTIVSDSQPLSLHLAGIGWPRSVPGLPSWVPDYTQSGRRTFQGGGLTVLGRLSPWHDPVERSAFASWSMRLGDMPSTATGYRTTVLSVRGMIMENHITKVLAPPLTDRGILAVALSGTADQQHRLLGWINGLSTLFMRWQRPYIEYTHPHQRWKASGRDTMLSVLTCRIPSMLPPLLHGPTFTLSMDRIDKLEPEPVRASIPSLRALENLFWRLKGRRCCYDTDCACPSVARTKKDTLQWEIFLSDLDEFSDWTIFETKLGYLGRGPPGVQVGDKLCVIQGARTPFVLRQRERWYDFLFPHRLVGEAFVAGLMSREGEFAAYDSWAPAYITLR